MIYIPRTKTDRMVNPREEKPVRLASLPFDIPPATHDETAPRGMPIKAIKAYASEPTMGPRTRKLYDYAASTQWKCTIYEAADAIGMNVANARKLAATSGFVHRFVGYHERPNSRGESNDNAMRSAIGANKRGIKVDVNLLPLDELIR